MNVVTFQVNACHGVNLYPLWTIKIMSNRMSNLNKYHRNKADGFQASKAYSSSGKDDNCKH